MPYYLKMFVCRFRTSSHSLRIQTDRLSRIRNPRNERICKVCNVGEIEDEYHSILKCPYYDFLRRKYLKKKRPNIIKLVELLNSNKKSELFNLALYLKLVLIKRTDFFHTENAVDR